MSKKIKIGVFGAGRGGRMIDILMIHPDAEVVAVCDKYQPLLDQIEKKALENGAYKVRFFNDFEDFIKCDMDAVILANNANEHAPYAIRCLEMGLHVMSECMACASMAQAVELIEAVERSGKVYTYAENYCYSYATFEMARLIREGNIGQIVYAEGEYTHDCTIWWPNLAYGDPDHWRNNAYSTFYCSHSIGPILFMTGLRPVRVTGFEGFPTDYSINRGSKYSNAGVEMITLENGSVIKSLHGDLRHDNIAGINSYYSVYGTEGQLETSRFVAENLHYFKTGSKPKDYFPKPQFAAEYVNKFSMHGGSDFYPTHLFVESILGREEGKKYAIDVYSAVDISICGILAFRSILEGNRSVEIPDLRDPARRDEYRNDHACTWKYEAGNRIWPHTSFPEVSIPEEIYEEQKSLREKL